MRHGGNAGLARVTLVDGDNLEGRQVQVGEASILQVMEVALCQGVPVPGIPAHHCAACPHAPLCCGHTAHPAGSAARVWVRAGTRQRPEGPRAPSGGGLLGSAYLRPLSCAFRLCSNRAASLKDTRRAVELVDRKRSVSASWPSGSSPLNSGSARRAGRGWAVPGAGSLWAGPAREGARGAPTDRQGLRGRWAGTRSSAHTLTRSARACEHLRVGFKETEMSRNRAAPSLGPGGCRCPGRWWWSSLRPPWLWDRTEVWQGGLAGSVRAHRSPPAGPWALRRHAVHPSPQTPLPLTHARCTCSSRAHTC